jgi:hypothetical protein
MGLDQRSLPFGSYPPAGRDRVAGEDASAAQALTGTERPKGPWAAKRGWPIDTSLERHNCLAAGPWRLHAATARAPPRSQFGATGRAGPSLTGSESEPVRRDERTERGAAKRLTELAVMVARIALAVAVTAKQKRSVAPGGGPPKNRADEEQFSRGWAEPPRSVGSADSAPPTPGTKSEPVGAMPLAVPNRNRQNDRVDHLCPVAASRRR